jgi:mevalonate pyrophosphate decarboxylase
VKINYTGAFFEKFSICRLNAKNNDTYDFSTCVKLRVGSGSRSGSGSASKWKAGSGSASTRCQSTTLDSRSLPDKDAGFGMRI